MAGRTNHRTQPGSKPSTLAVIFMQVRLLFISFLLGTLICLTNCSTNVRPTRSLEGDLYYDLMRIGNFYNQPDSIIRQVKLYVDTANRKLLTADNLRILSMYEILKKRELLYSPFIDLRLDNDSIIKIYLTAKDYDQIKGFHRKELLDTKKKIRIKLDVQDLGLGMALSTKIRSVAKIDGQTRQVNPKLKIEDYR